MSGILGKKLGMTRVFQDDGCVIPITLVECEPNEVVQVKTVEKDGYPAVVLGFAARKSPTKTKKFYHVREFKLAEGETFNKGDKITLDLLKEVKEVEVVGISKGKGFQGVMKRHNFHGGPASHGSLQHREPGSIGASAKPGRIAKGKKLPGHMGLDTVTRRNIKVSYIDPEKNLIGLKGPVPGPIGSLVIIRK